MRKINPNFIYDKNKVRRGVLLKIADYKIIMDELEDYDDYKTIKERKRKIYKTFSPESVLREILGNR